MSGGKDLWMMQKEVDGKWVDMRDECIEHSRAMQGITNARRKTPRLRVRIIPIERWERGQQDDTPDLSTM